MLNWAKSAGFWFGLLTVILVSRWLSMVVFPFADTTEPRYAEIARLMAETGDWITPWFKAGVPFWGKPPLSFWAQAGAIKLLGLNEFAVRFPSWLSIAAVVWLTWHYALTAHGAIVSRWSALILSTMALTYISAGAVMTDPFLTLGTTLSLVSFGMVIAHQAAVWRWLFFVGLVIGLLSKGPLALVLVAVPVSLTIITHRPWYSYLPDLPWVRGTIITLGLSLPWYIAAEIKTPGFLDYFIIGEHIKRFLDPGWTGDLYGNAHVHPKGMIWVFWTWASFPWGILAVGGLLVGVIRGYHRRLLSHLKHEHHTWFITLAALTPMLFFSLASNTLWTYALPSLPFSAILIARGVADWVKERSHFHKVALSLGAVAPLILTAFAISMAMNETALKTERPIVDHYETVQKPGDSHLFYLEEPPFSARFYSQGEVREITPDDLLRLYRHDHFQRYFVTAPKDRQKAVMERLPDATKVVDEDRRYVLIRLTQ
ncbi:glycosyltransferase family 39 protein [Halospina sp. K52047b]|uniref:ArnT family glycosyltransferase n=1 Tax=Halospina sp. K52047b TaxID=2614160 RepID=UPI00124A3C60|nr:glycosyltransferase family 39 protein [Halospina sp. K52047b]KAA8980352.1 glycosyltransferase family 39 protein [Halospina sp. K52047b]